MHIQAKVPQGKHVSVFKGSTINLNIFSDVNANPIEENVIHGVQFFKENKDHR